jgi:transposase-like protein
MARLTKEQKEDIVKRLKAGDAVSQLAEEYGTSKVNIYAIRNKAPQPVLTAVTALEAEIALAESRRAELQKCVAEMARLDEVIKVKKEALATLKNLEGTK